MTNSNPYVASGARGREAQFRHGEMERLSPAEAGRVFLTVMATGRGRGPEVIDKALRQYDKAIDEITGPTAAWKAEWTIVASVVASIIDNL
jgi:hypothetical protein